MLHALGMVIHNFERADWIGVAMVALVGVIVFKRREIVKEIEELICECPEESKEEKKPQKYKYQNAMPIKNFILGAKKNG